MVSQFKIHLEQQFPELLSTPFLVACSGGVDSVVLVYLCAALRLDFGIAHCNFKLRGVDSDQDAVFVQSIAEKLAIECMTTDFDTETYVVRNKVSIQMAARELRYAWFDEIIKNSRFKKVLTAHHQDDNLETFLINLSRGTGIKGLTGIPSSNAVIARPLLAFSRNSLMRYAKEEKIVWREDASNTELKYLRNKIRHEVVPVLKELHPTFQENFARTQGYLKESEALLSRQKEQCQASLFEENKGLIYVRISDLIKLSPLKAHLHLLFSDFGFTAWDDIEQLLSGSSGKEVRSKTHRLLRNRDMLLLEELMQYDDRSYLIDENATESTYPVPMKIAFVPAIKEWGDDVLYIDKETLKYPLVVRKWEKGDYFHPLGLGGKKKLSKYFKDEKMSIIAKQQQWLLCSGEDIVWVIGKRADERFKVQKKTEKIVKFKLNK